MPLVNKAERSSHDSFTLYEAACDVLATDNADEKAEKSRLYAARWRDMAAAEKIIFGDIADQTIILPDRPARPEKPELLAPAKMPKRRKAGSQAGRIALLHALAHIELNAIDLAWDIMARFCRHQFGAQNISFPIDFYEDWLKVADDEAKHFALLQARLRDFDAEYGVLPAHDGLWESAQATTENPLARLAIVPMVLEARGLDVTPNMIQNLTNQGDQQSADILQIIYEDEITHVAAGKVWFEFICQHTNQNPETTWQNLVDQYFNGFLKPPFNKPARDKADFPACWYEPIALYPEKEPPA